MELHCWAKDVAKFEKLGFVRQGASLPDKVALMVDEHANYAHYNELSRLKRVFFGQHGEGHGYNPHFFACDGQRYLDVVADCEGNLVVCVDKRGDPLSGDVARMKSYLKMLDSISKQMGLVYKDGIWGSVGIG
jgi:hypothetical protein